MGNIMRKLKNDNRGYSFMMVVFGVIFISAIGIIALTMAMNYFITTKVDSSSKKNFYEAEGIVAEFKTGLQEYAYQAGEEAYKEVLENYKTADSDTREEKFSKLFLAKLSDKLVGTGEIWDGSNDVTYPCNEEKVKALSNVPDSIQAAPGTNIEVVLNNEECTEKYYHLTLKNLYVDFENDQDYRSTITTDIVVKVPDYHFNGDTTFNELKNYIVIADDKLEISNTAGHSVAAGGSIAGAALRGNIYTGSTEDDAINIATQTQVALLSKRIISRGSMSMFTGSDVFIAGQESGDLLSDLWMQNIKVSPVSDTPTALYTDAVINAQSYIANDFVIDDAKSNITLNGSYYGYSYNENNTAVSTEMLSKYSSAFLINGVNTTLNTTGLNKLILAGRAFVSRNNESGTAVTSDILTGESFAVKSNQLAYLVPLKYINVEHNPVLQSEYSSNNVDKAKLLNDPNIGPYLNPSTPVVENFKQATSEDDAYVFYFLRFKDEKNANEYFKHYFQDFDNQMDLSDNARTYISTSDDSGLKLDAALYLLAGNIVNYYYAEGGGELKEANYFKGSGEPKDELLNDGITKGKSYVGLQQSLIPTGGTMMRLPSDAPALVTSKIIDFSELSGPVSKSYPELNATFLITPNSYTIDGSIKRGIIVSERDVTVSSSFEGLIIAGGKVTVTTNGIAASNNIVLAKSILKEIELDEELSKYFIGIKSFDGKLDNSVSVGECITYKNWKKNID